jgi:hypothetical protein
MVNIFNKVKLPFFFDNLFITNLEWDLLKYIDENLSNENNLLRWGLKTALKINANGEYI